MKLVIYDLKPEIMITLIIAMMLGCSGQHKYAGTYVQAEELHSVPLVYKTVQTDTPKRSMGIDMQTKNTIIKNTAKFDRALNISERALDVNENTLSLTKDMKQLILTSNSTNQLVAKLVASNMEKDKKIDYQTSLLLKAAIDRKTDSINNVKARQQQKIDHAEEMKDEEAKWKGRVEQHSSFNVSIVSIVLILLIFSVIMRTTKLIMVWLVNRFFPEYSQNFLAEL